MLLASAQFDPPPPFFLMGEGGGVRVFQIGLEWGGGGGNLAEQWEGGGGAKNGGDGLTMGGWYFAYPIFACPILYLVCS